MSTVDPARLDQAIGTAFDELANAMTKFNKDSIALYSAALEALVRLRQVTS